MDSSSDKTASVSSTPSTSRAQSRSKKNAPKMRPDGTKDMRTTRAEDLNRGLPPKLTVVFERAGEVWLASALGFPVIYTQGKTLQAAAGRLAERLRAAEATE